MEPMGEHVMVIFVDIYGNEARELIPVERFGVKVRNGGKPSRKKGAK
jgi:hypothetical protein